MTPERWRQVEEIFQAAVERDGEERDDFLTEACGGDAELRSEVESLLDYETARTLRGQPFQQAIKGAARSLTIEQIEPEAPGDNLIGRRIGAYRVANLIGRGGMGAVYLAERDDAQFDQQVAIKVIKRGMDTDFIRERFLRERQILAGLDHPHVARLLDGGATEDGLPYFVMEHVAGVAITDYCETNKLSITERLKLFRQVCAAVQHAHQKLVAHRDLKPSNILVNRDGAPKLLDFGVAKLLASDADQTRTRTEQRMLTPDYASPEQVRGETITTAADIYSLGVVLYELLTGRRLRQFKTASPAEIERAICETEPAKPSDAVSPETVSAGKLQKQLAGDLDNIVLMAMRNEPERRYQSVEQFSEDIRRHLEGLPVIARQDTMGYRAGKFIRRHKLGVAATTLVIASLTAGVAVANYQARRAERRFQQVRKLANTFLFDFHDKIQNLPGSTEAREMVVKTALEYLDSLATEAAGDVTLEGELAVAYQKVGDVQGDPWAPNLGQTEAAMLSYQKSVRLAQKLASRDGSDLLIRRTLAEGYFKLGALQSESGDKLSANATMRQAIGDAETLARQTGDVKDLVRVENLYTRLGDTQLDTGDAASALQSYRQSHKLTESRAALHPSDNARIGVATGHSHIGEALAAMGDLTGAIESYSLSVRMSEELVERQPTNQFYLRLVRVNHSWLGRLSWSAQFVNLGDEQAAIRHYRKALAIAERQVEADPQNARARQDLAIDAGNLAEALTRSDPARAAELFRRALAAMRPLLEASPNEFMYLRRETDQIRGLAGALWRMGDRQGALRHLQRSLAQSRALAARDPVNTQVQADLHSNLLSLGELSLELGDHASSLEHYRQALALVEALGQAPETSIYARWRKGDAYAGLGKYHAALAAAPKTSPEQRRAHRGEACAWRRKALGVWDSWNQYGVSSVFNAAKREQAARALTQCEAAISRPAADQKP